MSSHYSHALDPGVLLELAERKALSLLELPVKSPDGSLVLCYRGMSGIAHATAIALALAKHGTIVKMVYVRKEEEISHGNEVEWSDAIYVPEDTLIFVDDFISDGKTYEAVVRGLKSNYPHVLREDQRIDLVCLARQTTNTHRYVAKHNLKVI